MTQSPTPSDPTYAPTGPPSSNTRVTKRSNAERSPHNSRGHNAATSALDLHSPSSPLTHSMTPYAASAVYPRGATPTAEHTRLSLRLGSIACTRHGAPPTTEHRHRPSLVRPQSFRFSSATPFSRSLSLFAPLASIVYPRGATPTAKHTDFSLRLSAIARTRHGATPTTEHG